MVHPKLMHTIYVDSVQEGKRTFTFRDKHFSGASSLMTGLDLGKRLYIHGSSESIDLHVKLGCDSKGYKRNQQESLLGG